MQVGVLTGGGDCPGLNAVIRAVVRKGEVDHGDTFIGFRDGWKGLTENITRPLDVEHCRASCPGAEPFWVRRAPIRTRSKAASRPSERR